MMKRWRYILFLFVLIGATEVEAQRLSLDSCKVLATQNNVKTRNATLNVEKAKQVKYQALTKYFPNISITGAAYHSLHPLFEYGINDIQNAEARNILNTVYAEYGAAIGLENTFSLFQKGYLATATAMQPIFMGGRIVNGNRLAELGVEAAQYQNSMAEQEVLMQTEESYWLVLSINEKLKTIGVASELLDTLERDVQTALQAGLVTQNDALKVTIKKNELRSSLLKAENGKALATMALCQLVGIPYCDSIVLVDTIPAECPAPLNYFKETNEAVTSRDESQLLEVKVNAEKLEKKMTLGETLPQVALGGSYGYSHLFDKATNKTNGLLFATVQIPITAWWETGHKLKAHDLDIEMAENEQRDLEEKMALQTQQAWNSLCEGYEQILIAQENVENAQENLRNCSNNYRAGFIPLSELLEAQTLVRQALDTLADERISYLLQLTRYCQMTGQ